MGDRVVVLDKGKIQQAANPEEIYNNPSNTFVAGFVGSPQMNFINSEHFPNISKENVILGIRPEKMVTGSEKIAYFNIGDKKCPAKLSADYDIGKTLKLSINPTDIYYFDKETGARI